MNDVIRIEDGHVVVEAQPERSLLDVATEFLAEHQVVELLQAGGVPLVSYTVVRMPDGLCKTVRTIHVEQPDGTDPEAFKETRREVSLAHVWLRYAMIEFEERRWDA